MANQKTPDKGRKKTKIENNRPIRVGGLIACIVLVTMILSINLLPSQVSLSDGDMAGEDVYYTGATTTYISTILTNEARSSAAADVGQIYVIDEAVVENIHNIIDEYFNSLNLAAGKMDIEGVDYLEELRNSLPGVYDDSVLKSLLNMSRSERASLATAFKKMISDAYAHGVAESETTNLRQELAIVIGSSTISGDAELFLKTLLEALTLTYNKVYDSLATAAAIDAAMNAVEEVEVTIHSGQRLLSRGELITAEQIEALQAVNMHSESASGLPYIGLFGLMAVLLVMIFIYMRSFQRQLYNKGAVLLLLIVVIVAILAICKLISLIEINSAAADFNQIGYLLPVATASMLLAVLLNRDTAIIVTVFLSICIGIIMDGGMAFALTALAGGLAGVLSAANLNQRSQFVGASLYIAGANIVVIAAWGLLFNLPMSIILPGMIFGLVNGLFSAILAMGMLPFLESLFGITTVIRLLELSNSNHPLLKQLMMEAPGTYNHSILVGNLAEAAADAISANTLLVRVASYYHDIGKLKRPHFFIENQRLGENPHDKLQPALSAMIITSHTTDGVKMLKEQRFPMEIIDVVEQHHGDTTLAYFYHKAKETALDPEDVKIDDYRYKGRRPQTKEAALVMLADSVQAAVQALSGNDPNQIVERVNDVVQGKIEDGQLRECPLTFRDIEAISQSFLMVLSGMNHIRISYPDQEIGGVQIEASPADRDELHGDITGKENVAPAAESGE